MRSGPGQGHDLAPIVCAVDDRYVTPLCVLMQSLAAAHPGRSLQVIVMHQGLNGASQRRIRWHADRLGLDVSLRQAPGVDPRYPVSMWVTNATYLRLALPEVVPEAPVVLYLDVDLLVLRDLGPLLARRLDGVPLAAVRDPLNPTLDTGFGIPGWEDLGLPGSREYFNGGVLLLNLGECRRREIFTKSDRFAREMSEHILFWDQDAMNWAVDDDWHRLDRCWNTLALSALQELDIYKDWKYSADHILPFSRLIDDEDTAAVLHFAGPVKPWSPEYPASPHKDLYLSFMTTVEDHEP
jgi:UDP-D-galactose:(glucosyl)LPS alpha-1,3-D-galactosyltransferase